MHIKRGTRIEYTFAAGKVVAGKILRAVKGEPDWFVCRLTDEVGDFVGSCHINQIRITDNH